MKIIRTAVLLTALAAGTVHAAPAQDDTAWVEQKTTASDGTANTYFGSATAMRGSTVVIGADGDQTFTGAAYVLSNTGDSWTEGQKLTADDGLHGDEFGYRIALADDQMAIAAFTAAIGDFNAQGAVYMFARNDGNWAQSQKLLADDGQGGDNFGSSVSLDGSTLFIGAIGGGTSGDFHGAVYVFTQDNGTWTQSQKLVADDGNSFDNFGFGVVVKGDTAIITAPTAPVAGVPGQGAAYVFSRSGGEWTQTQKIVASDGSSFARFGMGLAFDGSNIVIGATGVNAVYAFANDGTGWTQTQRITGKDSVSGDDFGNTIALDGNTMLIGGDIATVDGDTSRGAAYLFEAGDSGWVQTHKFVASDGTTDDFFGAALSLQGDTALISTVHPTINGNSWQGAAYFYTRDTLFADGFDG